MLAPAGRRDIAARRRPAVHAVSAVALAATLAAPPAGAGAALLRLHSRGPAVATAQRALGVSADGEFGPLTRAAVLAFQRAHGLEADGIVGPVTSAALGVSASGVAPSPPPSTTRALQGRLGLVADGVYGPLTRVAVARFQRSRGLEVDGVVGPRTLAALGLSGSGSSAGSGALAAARSQLGAPYVYGGTGAGGFDCSGLTQWAMGRAGISLPRTSYSQFGVGAPVVQAAIQAGDLVFWDTDGTGASHVGIATGAGTAISATTHGVREHSISGDYWGARYVGARRVG